MVEKELEAEVRVFAILAPREDIPAGETVALPRESQKVRVQSS